MLVKSYPVGDFGNVNVCNNGTLPYVCGAIINARIPNVYFGAYDKKYGACGSVINIFNMKENFKVTYEGGFKGKESLELFDKFFKYLRNKRT